MLNHFYNQQIDQCIYIKIIIKHSVVERILLNMPLSQSRHSRNDRCQEKTEDLRCSRSLSFSLSREKNHNPPLDMWFRQTRIRFTKFSLHCQFAMSFSVNGKYKIDTL